MQLQSCDMLLPAILHLFQAHEISIGNKDELGRRLVETVVKSTVNHNGKRSNGIDSPINSMLATELLKLAFSLNFSSEILINALMDDVVLNTENRNKMPDSMSLDITLSINPSQDVQLPDQNLGKQDDTTKENKAITKGELFYDNFQDEVIPSKYLLF
jgi:hypothetical protein